jgi:hypothetical protein
MVYLWRALDAENEVRGVRRPQPLEAKAFLALGSTT